MDAIYQAQLSDFGFQALAFWAIPTNKIMDIGLSQNVTISCNAAYRAVVVLLFAQISDTDYHKSRLGEAKCGP
jgi:hypothetical protein